jgi:UDP-3-O-[3-hydroxymyristoyl] glucosamine N-acyltransferase
MAVSLGELAVRFGCELRGDPAALVDSVAPLSNAGERAVTFLANPRYRQMLSETRAGVVVIDKKNADACAAPVLITANPYLTYARIATQLHPVPVAVPGIHPTAVVAPTAKVDPSAEVGPLAVVKDGASIGARSIVGALCAIDENVTVAEDVRLASRVALYKGVVIGARTIIHSGAVVGSDGFGFAPDRGTWVRVPQVGTVRVGADVEIGANTTIDRGAIEDTVIEDGVKLDNQIQIGHNVRIGAHTAIAACVGIAGSAVIGKRCQIGGAVGIVGHLSIADDVAITGFTMVSHSIDRPGVYSSGMPHEDARQWRRIVGRFKRLDSYIARLTALEKAVGVSPKAASDEAEQDK